MDKQEIIKELQSQGYQKVYVWDALPGEIDEEHQHDFDTLIIIISGQIQITSLVNDVITNTSHQRGAQIFIERNMPHSAKVGPEGCLYVVAEKH